MAVDGYCYLFHKLLYALKQRHVGKGTKKSVMTPKIHDGNKLCMLGFHPSFDFVFLLLARDSLSNWLRLHEDWEFWKKPQQSRRARSMDTRVAMPTLTRPGIMKLWLSRYLPMTVVPLRSKFTVAMSEG